MSVEVIIDLFNMQKPEGKIEVRDQEGYTFARRVLLDPKSTDGEERSLRILIHNPGMQTWFDDLVKTGRALLSRIDPCDELAKALGARNLPQAIIEDPKSVIELDLLDLAKANPMHRGQSIIDWILSHKLGYPWDMKELKQLDAFVKIVEWYLRRGTAEMHPVLLDIQQRRINCWSAQQSEIGDLIQWFFEEPHKRSSVLLCSQMLLRYPEEKQALWLQEDGLWASLCQLPDRQKWLLRLPKFRDIVNTVSPALNTYVNDYLGAILEEEGLECALDMVSGCLPGEIRALRRFIETKALNGILFSELELSRVVESFMDADEAQSLVKLAKSLRPMNTPTIPHKDWEWTSIRKWIQEEYIPYYDWVCMLDKVLDTTDHVKAFEDWLIANYADLTRMPDALIFTIKRILDKYRKLGQVILIVIDGLGWSWVHTLSSALEIQGLYIQEEPELRLAVVPSITSVSKPVLVRGQPQSQLSTVPGNIAGYIQLFAEGMSVNPSHISGASDRDVSIYDVLSGDEDLFIYLLNELDEKILHKGYAERTRREKHLKLLEDFAGDLADAITEYEQLYGKGIYVIIVGDHGYTVLPRESKTIDVCEDTIISHGRAVEGIIDLDEDSCWVVRDNVGMLKQNYTIARGYRYLGSRPRGAVHGGMTPQELAVPVLVASRQKVETPMDLAIVIEGPIRRRRRVNPISIEIANPNRFPVIVNEVKLHLVEILGHTPQKINASSKLSLDAIFDSSNIYEENVEVRGVISYILNGRDRANLVEMSIKTEGAAIVDKAFEDEFDV